MEKKNGKRWIAGAAVFLAVCLAANAAYLRNFPVQLKQPDGSTLSCLASGDEFYNWLHDQNGYTIIRSSANGFYVYAKKVQGTLVPTTFIAGRTEPYVLEAAGIKRHLLHDPSPARARQIMMMQAGPVVNAPPTGTINNLVVFIRFSGETEFTQTTVDSFKNMFNDSSAAANSMKNYYKEASYSQLTINSTFYPGSVPNVYSYQDSYQRSYYQPYDATSNPDGYQNESARTTREHTLLKNAIGSISSEVPPGLNIDTDGDGTVDNVCFVVKGDPTAWSTLLWPHQWSLYTYAVYINSKRVWTYNFQLETAMNVGVLCHEMFHSIGAPDLYHNENGAHADLEPVFFWDLMEWNLDPPEHMGSYMKYKYGKWISSIPEITTSGTYALSPLTSSTNNCYKIRSPFSSTEFYVVEYRKQVGTFEGYLFHWGQPQGLLVYRIDPAVTGNFNGPPDEVYIYRPDGTVTQDGSPGIAPLSVDAGRIQINDSTNPSSFLTAGTHGGLKISNVSAVGATISFDVTIDPITLTAPNGGEKWPAGSAHAITWTTTASIANVKIDYSTNSGISWTPVVASTPNSGSYAWTLPNVASLACLVKVSDASSSGTSDTSDAVFSITGAYDLLGTWDGQGVYYRNSSTGEWVQIASPADLITGGDLDGDGIDDLIGIWPSQGGVWVKYSGSGQWALLSSTARDIAAGDMNGDGREDLLGTWDGQGVYYRNSIGGGWVMMASPADKITTGDLDGDGISDLIGIWPGQGGVWVKYSKTGTWALLSSTARDIATGDVNGDGRVDLVGTWDGQGVYYRDSISGAWVMMASPADQVTCGDLDGDGISDLIGIWPSQGGVWAKYSKTGTWALLSSTARDITVGRVSQGGASGAPLNPAFISPLDGSKDSPGRAAELQDALSRGPGGKRFVYETESNLVPREIKSEKSVRVPGPGEPGFHATAQKNLVPRRVMKKGGMYSDRGKK